MRDLEHRLGATDPALAAAVSELTQRGYVVAADVDTIELTVLRF